MGTRPGDLDPGLLLQLMRLEGLSVDAAEDLLSRRSGFLGLAGSSDLREVEARAAAGDDAARLALQVFAHRVRKYIGAYAAVMGGIDAVVFTGGIGARSAPVRARVCEGLQWLGATIDHERNESGAARIEAPGSSILIAATPTNEELVIARHTRDLVHDSAGAFPS